MKKLFWDVETSSLDLLIRTYQLKNYTKYFDPKLIKRDWTMLGASWAFDDEAPKVISVKHDDVFNDRHVIETLHGVLNEADVLIGHNSDAFDFKKFNTRAIYYDLPPIAPSYQIDTLKMARKYFKFTSNKLSYIADFLGLDSKDESPDWDLILGGDKKELSYMRKYNKQDVVVTRDVYKKLASYHSTHPRVKKLHRGVWGEAIINCRTCGGHLDLHKTRQTNMGKARYQYQCYDCGRYQTETKKIY